ncbi:bifunctional 3-(3-hydroxy-phenyl)propionate/3-hydroxycinnamic acid hydroxylase [Burkholderia plantarii]|uniref:bifunctional 3-(3-hydroxy-phenyl)propionate/3-hydroxycinnamic acid hydroxylase MhpA n=1 Tax=Burkholderia plantarii TaxID=41899 RepID=UPI000B161CA6|nr:bifunctional 3-(3-hydroxy-phenyl)propionate/3-hydroxycinnamic acid hydroxylase [Burkholderia plantarii]
MKNFYDVAIVGYGPVGQMQAAKLSQLGHEVVVFERFPGLYGMPRAGHIDHEVMRIFQSVGASEEVAADAFPMTKYVWRNADGKTLISFDWDQTSISGWKSDYLFFQPYMEAALDRSVRSTSKASVYHGWEAIGLIQHEDGVELTVRKTRDGASDPEGERKTVRASYLVGADGANSFVRESVGLSYEDFGFQENWLVTDFKPTRPLKFDFDNGQVCDPKRPMCLFQLGQSHRRFEFMLLPGETKAEMENPDSIWELVSPWISPDDANLIRRAVYTFQSKLVRDWRRGRVLLIGDSVHLMPPFMGQGMCSGVRDAANLAWKLDLVLRGVASDTLLDSYTVERRPHVRKIIEQSTELGRVSCTTQPEVAKARDEAFFAGVVPPPPPFPHLESGLLLPGGWGDEIAGRLGPQGRLRSPEGTEALCDDLVAVGWHLITFGDLPMTLDQATRQALDCLLVRWIPIDAPGGYEDIDGTYREYFEAKGVRAVLIRPDFYVFGGARNADELVNLIHGLITAIPIQEAALG